MQFEGVHREIALRGIERAGQDTMITDGAMNEVIGLDMRDGSYVPYAPSSEDVSLPKDTIVVRWHHTSTGNNLIAVDNNLSLFFKKENNEAWQYVCQLPSAEIAFLGNAICTTESGFYLLWKDSQYEIKRKEAFPRLSLRAIDMNGVVFTETDSSYNDDTRYRKLANDCNDAGYLHQMHLCRYAVLLADGSYAYISNPFLIPHPLAKESYEVIKNDLMSNSMHSFLTDTSLYCKQLQYKIDGEIDEEKVIGVKIFLTQGRNLYNLSKIFVQTGGYEPQNRKHPVYNQGIYDTCITDMQEDDIYYNVYTIYPKDIVTGEWHGISLAGHLGDHLQMGDILSLQQLDKYNAERLFVYNSRLHMMNVKKSKNKDIQLSDFYYRNSGSSKDYADTFIDGFQEIDSNIVSITVHRATQDAEFDIGYVYNNPEAFSGLACRITIHYKDGHSETVYCDNNLTDILMGKDKPVSENIYRITTWYKNTNGSYVVVSEGYVFDALHYLNPYLSVCSRDATRILLEVKVNGSYYKIDKSLKASETQDVAYFFDTTLNPIRWEETTGFVDGITESNNSAMSHLVVSATGFPNVFENDEYHFDGVSRVIDCCHMSLELTNDNFGYFPLAVFTDNGIYTLKVSDSGKYAYGQKDKLSEEVCTNRGMICRTDKGILFSTKRGLFVLGERPNEALRFLIGEPRHIAMPDDTYGHGLYIYHCAVNGESNGNKIADIAKALSREDVRELIQDECFLEYDKNCGKCILWSPKVKYLYVIDLQYLSATKLESNIELSDKEGGYYEFGD